jgi:predicted unusual protein kinase regulating ubiquinone biosynthesis (AarF/ABC1/UbiB family)
MADPKAKKPRRRSRVPTGRLERLARFGLMAGELAVGGVAESVRRVTGGAGDGGIFLNEANAQRLAKRLAGMRGAAMKLGQLLSMEGEDLFPPEVSEALALLRNDGDAMPADQLRRVLGHAWGKGWLERFESFDFEPIAAASIGQVHQAHTRDGRALALKIQYPGVAKSTASDVDNLAAVLKMSRLLPSDVEIDPLIAEAKRQLRQEADYEAEARSLRRYGALLADDSFFRVPVVHDDFTTRHVLAMDRLEGLPLEDLCGADHPQERRDRVGRALLELLLRELFEFRFSQTDPNIANYLWLEDGRVGLLDLGAAREVPGHVASSYAQLCRASMDHDRGGLEAAALGLGVLPAGETPERRTAVLDFVELAAEPFRHAGVYDFGESDLPRRAREAAARLAFRHGFRNPPPPEILFLQRKLGGTFLQCARLRARIDVRGLLEETFARLGIVA